MPWKNSTPGCPNSSAPCAPTTSPFSHPTTAATPPRPLPTTAVSTCRCWFLAPRSGKVLTSECAPRFPTSARPWPKISARPSRKGPVSYRKSYEKTSHGGQLENVQDARGNHRILREIPAAGRKIRTLRDRDLPPFHEP